MIIFLWYPQERLLHNLTLTHQSTALRSNRERKTKPKIEKENIFSFIKIWFKRPENGSKGKYPTAYSITITYVLCFYLIVYRLFLNWGFINMEL